MDAVVQITVTGLTLGAMYALAAVGLSLVWGTLGMCNMAHGALMVVGAYAALAAVQMAGLPWPAGILAALAVPVMLAVLIHAVIVRRLIRSANFDTNILIATAGVGILLQDLILKAFGGYPFAQPLRIDGGVALGGVTVAAQSLVIMAAAAVLLALTGAMLAFTRFGIAIRATAMNLDAARLMGIRTGPVYLAVLALSAALAGAAGLMISTLTTLSPGMGGDPMLKAFVICVVAGLGSLPGVAIAAVVLGLVEAAVQFWLGVRYGFPVMLAFVVLVLILRPDGLVGRRKVVRL